MLQKVSIGRPAGAMRADVERYRSLVGDQLLEELFALAKVLANVRVCHINATAYGGGVAELLSRELPILQALGLAADWRLIHGQPEFFTITKAIHNALQGADYEIDQDKRRIYLDANEHSARLLDANYDVIIVHDPQPAAIRHFTDAGGAKWIWRCHVDSSSPNAAIAEFLAPLLRDYDAMVFTMDEFVLPQLTSERIALIQPAIDPLSTKNMDLPIALCRAAIAAYGIDVTRPLLVQVARFDPWKDPMGVIEVYQAVKREIPTVQLALIGSMAGDDPEGWELLDRVQEEAMRDHDLFVFTNLGGVGNMDVNAFQRGGDVAIQKSIREGFGLVVSEALWKGTAVVAGKAGGIPMQFPDGYEDYLVESTEACAARTVELLRHPDRRAAFGRAARAHIQANFLLPRLIRDELRLIASVLERET